MVLATSSCANREVNVWSVPGTSVRRKLPSLPSARMPRPKWQSTYSTPGSCSVTTRSVSTPPSAMMRRHDGTSLVVALALPDAAHVVEHHAERPPDGDVAADQAHELVRVDERVEVVARALEGLDQLEVVHAEGARVDDDRAGHALVAQPRLEGEVAA